MRRVRCCLAVSLDGFIAGPKGEADWIVMDPGIDFEAFYKDFDTLLMGRRTYEVVHQAGGGPMPGMQTVVCSRTLHPTDHPNVTIAGGRTEALKTRTRRERHLPRRPTDPGRVGNGRP